MPSHLPKEGAQHVWGFSHRRGNDRGRSTAGAWVVVATLLAGLLAGLLTVTGSAPASAATLGPGRPSVPGFVGYVTRSGGELGIGRLGNGTFGVCIDTGSQHGWPGGTPSSKLITSPRVGFVVSKYIGTARGNPRAAVALWWLVGKDFGLNSQPGAMQARIDQMRSESPGIFGDVKDWHDRMLADADNNAPAAAGYDARTIELANTDPATGRVTGIGAKDRKGQWVSGYRVTLTMTGATFDTNGKTTWTGTTGSTGKSLNWTQNAPGKVTVEQAVSGLPNNQYRLYDAHALTQRVVASAGTAPATGTDALAPDDGWARVRKVDAATGAGLAGARFQAWADMDGDGLFDPSEDNQVLTSGPAGWTARYRSFRGLRVCFKETEAPTGYGLNETPACVRARRVEAVAETSVSDEKIWNPALSTQISSELVMVGTEITDEVTVTDTGGHTVPGEWRLLGPVEPVSGRCVNLDWSAAAVAASGAFTATGDGVVTVGAFTVVEPGCFTYQERLAPTRATTEVFWTEPGVVSETTLVKSTPKITTQINRQLATAGAVLVDQVLVTGTYGATVTGTWRLLGPIAPNEAGRCTRLSWSDAPVAAQGRFTVRGDGTGRVGRYTTTTGGCFTYAEALTGTGTTTSTGWTRPGTVAETALVRPSQPRVPAQPIVPSGGESTTPPAPFRREGPAGEVAVDAVGLGSPLVRVGFVGSTLSPPSDIRTAGIWRAGAPLDAVVGSTVVVGHVSDNHDRPGELGKLSRAKVGQRITTRAPDGSVQVWQIRRVWLTQRTNLPRSIFVQGVSRHLVLVTCARKVTYTGGGFHYTHNLIVDATPLRNP